MVFYNRRQHHQVHAGIQTCSHIDMVTVIDCYHMIAKVFYHQLTTQVQVEQKKEKDFTVHGDERHRDFRSLIRWMGLWPIRSDADCRPFVFTF